MPNLNRRTEAEEPEEIFVDSGRKKRQRQQPMKAAPQPMKAASAAGKRKYAEKTKNGHKFGVPFSTGGWIAKQQNCPKKHLYAAT